MQRMYEAMAATRGRATADYGMGFIFYNRYLEKKSDVGNLMRAVEYLKRAVAEGDLYRAHYYLGLSYMEARQYEKAGQAFISTREGDVDGRYLEQTSRMLLLINSLHKIGFKNIPALPGWEEPAAR
ncbi:MAG TPA: hypothetical protein ENI12_06655 [Nitrospirae bacterium]|nr:hypothetical protein [Nitrospirota bacterium]